MRYPRIVMLSLAMAMIGVTTVNAQSTNRFAIGASFTTRKAENGVAHGSNDFGVAWRIGHSKSGFSWQYGLSWFSTDIDQPIGGSTIELGELRVRPFMGGYGYTQVIGRVALSTNMLGGFAYNTLHLNGLAANAYRDRLGATALDAQAHWSPVVKPELEMWIDLSKKVGLSVNGGYVITRPTVTLRSTLGSETRRFRADSIQLKAAVVYSIF